MNAGQRSHLVRLSQRISSCEGKCRKAVEHGDETAADQQARKRDRLVDELYETVVEMSYREEEGAA